MWKPVSRNLDVAICSLLQQYPKKHVIIASRTTVSYLSRIGRRYDPRHGPSIYKNPHEDNTRLEGAEFDKHYRTRDDVEVDFTDRRIDTQKNPSRYVTKFLTTSKQAGNGISRRPAWGSKRTKVLQSVKDSLLNKFSILQYRKTLKGSFGLKGLFASFPTRNHKTKARTLCDI